MIVISNASPLIMLAKLGLFDLLQRLFSHLTVAQEVWHEVALQGAGLPGSIELQQAVQAGWVIVKSQGFCKVAWE
jgi:predicted nucleic acid-binding protein